ncbi:hypothetical protein AAMO2058_001508100, partial [Amorphochlora amoebiformis]
MEVAMVTSPPQTRRRPANRGRRVPVKIGKLLPALLPLLFFVFVCIGGVEAVVCPPGMASKDTINTTCVNCTDGQYCPGGNNTFVALCDAGFYCPTVTTRLQCPDSVQVGYYCPPGLTIYEACPKGFYCPNSTTIINCTVAQQAICENEGVITVVDCDSGVVCNPDTLKPNSSIKCDGGSYCPKGTLGYTAPAPRCPAGHYCSSPIDKIRCSKGSYCKEGSEAETPCRIGYYCPNATVELKCPTSRYCPQSSTEIHINIAKILQTKLRVDQSSIALRVQLHKGYAPQASIVLYPVKVFHARFLLIVRKDQHRIHPVKKGTIVLTSPFRYRATRDSFAILGKQDQANVPKGFIAHFRPKSLSGRYCPENSTTLNPCPPGSYCPSADLAPIECNSNTGDYCPAGVTSPGRCPIGKYCPQPSFALDCNTGKYCAEGSNSSDDCPWGHFCPNSSVIFKCPNGTYCKPGSIVPVNCSKGSYCRTPSEQLPCKIGDFCIEGSTQFARCPAGYFCADTRSKSLCTLGNYCQKGSQSQSGCTPGYYCPNPTTRIQCPKGSLCPANQQTPQICQSGGFCPPTVVNNLTLWGVTQVVCSAGFYCPENSTELKPCPAGFFCADSKEAVPCESNTTVWLCSEGSSRQEVCPKGSECKNSTTAELCQIGFFSSSDDGVKNCLPCPADTYCPDRGTSNPRSCPTNAISPPGSTDVTQCQCNTAIGFQGTIKSANSACKEIPNQVQPELIVILFFVLVFGIALAYWLLTSVAGLKLLGWLLEEANLVWLAILSELTDLILDILVMLFVVLPSNKLSDTWYTLFLVVCVLSGIVFLTSALFRMQTLLKSDSSGNNKTKLNDKMYEAFLLQSKHKYLQHQTKYKTLHNRRGTTWDEVSSILLSKNWTRYKNNRKIERKLVDFQAKAMSRQLTQLENAENAIKQLILDAFSLCIESIPMSIIGLLLFDYADCNDIRIIIFRISLLSTGIMCGAKMYKMVFILDHIDEKKMARDVIYHLVIDTYDSLSKIRLYNETVKKMDQDAMRERTAEVIKTYETILSRNDDKKEFIQKIVQAWREWKNGENNRLWGINDDGDLYDEKERSNVFTNSSKSDAIQGH